MYSPCTREVSEICYHGCCPTPFLGLPEPETSTSITSAAASRCDFEVAMAYSIYPNSHFTNHESLPSLQDAFSNFIQTFPQYSLTYPADKIREKEYYHLSLSNHICLDYIGHGLFSYSQQQSHCLPSSSASTSTSPPLRESPLFDISFKSVNLSSQLQYSGPESELENKTKKRIMAFMNISEGDYTMVFTANESSAFKLLADSYPFQSHRNLLTVYDYENEAVKLMIENSTKKGAQVMSAEFLWPTLRINSGKLQKKIVSKRKTKKRGLFVFPLQSRVTGSRYSYFWMSMAQENGWHVLLDACALGPKDMETLGLSLFKPDFLICSFFNVFGANPSGFGCLFVKKSTTSVLKDSTTASIGMVTLIPPMRPSMGDIVIEPKVNLEFYNDDILQGSSSNTTSSRHMSNKTSELQEIEEINVIEKASPSVSIIESNINENPIFEYKGLDHADSLGLILISSRARFLINWLVNALMSLQYPHSENGQSLVRIYGPKVRFDRGPAVAFNIFDWNGEKVDPALVQKLADRNNISLSHGFLHHIWLPDKYREERWILSEKKNVGHCGVAVVTAAIGFLTNFDDVYRLWSFVSRFLDADFVEKERWRYTALNQNTIEV